MAKGEIVVEVKTSRMARAILAAAAAAVSPVLWFYLVLLAGLALVVAGVAVLVGLGWAMIAAGACCLLVAYFIFRGVTNG